MVKISVLVAPNSKRKCVKYILGMFKFCLSSPAVDGRANQELIETVARILSLPKKAIRLVGGLTSKHKRLEIDFDGDLKEVEDLFFQGFCQTP